MCLRWCSASWRRRAPRTRCCSRRTSPSRPGRRRRPARRTRRAWAAWSTPSRTAGTRWRPPSTTRWSRCSPIDAVRTKLIDALARLNASKQVAVISCVSTCHARRSHAPRLFVAAFWPWAWHHCRSTAWCPYHAVVQCCAHASPSCYSILNWQPDDGGPCLPSLSRGTNLGLSPQPQPDSDPDPYPDPQPCAHRWCTTWHARSRRRSAAGPSASASRASGMRCAPPSASSGCPACRRRPTTSTTRCSLSRTW